MNNKIAIIVSRYNSEITGVLRQTPVEHQIQCYSDQSYFLEILSAVFGQRDNFLKFHDIYLLHHNEKAWLVIYHVQLYQKLCSSQ